MSTGGETIGVAEVQLRVGGAPGFDRAMAAAGMSTKALGTTIQTTSQTSGQAWAKLFSPPPVKQKAFNFGEGPPPKAVPGTRQFEFGFAEPETFLNPQRNPEPSFFGKSPRRPQSEPDAETAVQEAELLLERLRGQSHLKLKNDVGIIPGELASAKTVAEPRGVQPVVSRSSPREPSPWDNLFGSAAQAEVHRGADVISKEMSASEAKAKVFAAAVEATAQKSQAAWAKIAAGPTVAQRMGGMQGGPAFTPAFPHGGEKLPEPIRELVIEKPANRNAEKAEQGLDKAQKATTLSGRAKAIVLSRMSAGASEMALALTSATNKEAAFRSALVASSADIAGAVSLVGAMSGGAAGLAVAIGASAVPALIRWGMATDDVKARAAELATEVDVLVNKFQMLQSVRESGREATITAQIGEPKDIVAQRQALTQEIKLQDELLKNRRDNLVAAQRKAAEAMAPGPGTEESQRGGAALKGIFTGGFSRPSDVETKFNQTDFDKLYPDIGKWLLKAQGIDIKKLSETGTSADIKAAAEKAGLIGFLQQNANAIAGIGSPEVRRKAIERQFGESYYGQQKAAGLPNDLLLESLSPKQREQLSGNEMFGKEAEGIEKTQAERDKADRALQEFNSQQRKLTIDESLFQDADRRGYKKMLIERQRLQRENQLKDAGFIPGSAEYGINNQIASRKTEEVDRGNVAGVMNVSSLHDAIQNMIARNDDARQTAINTKEMATTLKQMQERGQYGLTDHPDGPPARLAR